jgi:hypothetical protein
MPIRSSGALCWFLEYMSIPHFRPRMEQRFRNPILLHISNEGPEEEDFQKRKFNTVDQLEHKIFLEGTTFCWALEFLRNSQTTGKIITHCLRIAWVRTDYHLKNFPSNLLCCTSQMAVLEEDGATLANETQGTSHGGLPLGEHSEEQRNPLFAVLGNLSRLYSISPFVPLEENEILVTNRRAGISSRGLPLSEHSTISNPYKKMIVKGQDYTICICKSPLRLTWKGGGHLSERGLQIQRGNQEHSLALPLGRHTSD